MFLYFFFGVRNICRSRIFFIIICNGDGIKTRNISSFIFFFYNPFSFNTESAVRLIFAQGAANHFYLVLIGRRRVDAVSGTKQTQRRHFDKFQDVHNTLVFFFYIFLFFNKTS